MTKELREQMDALRQIGPKLNQASEDAAKVIAEVESFLNGLNLGIAGESGDFRHQTFIDEEVGPNAWRQYSWCLAYGDSPYGWCIHVLQKTQARSYEDDGTEVYEDIARMAHRWSSCSRSDRLQSFATLESLLASVTWNAQYRAKEADATAVKVRETMTTLGIEPTIGDNLDAKPARKPRS